MSIFRVFLSVILSIGGLATVSPAGAATVLPQFAQDVFVAPEGKSVVDFIINTSRTNALVTIYDDSNDVTTEVILLKRSGNSWVTVTSFKEQNAQALDDYWAVDLSNDGQHVLLEGVGDSNDWYVSYDYNTATKTWQRHEIYRYQPSSSVVSNWLLMADMRFASKANVLVWTSTRNSGADSIEFRVQSSKWLPGSHSWSEPADRASVSQATSQMTPMISDDGSRIIFGYRFVNSDGWALKEAVTSTLGITTVSTIKSAISNTPIRFATASLNLNSVNFSTRNPNDRSSEQFWLSVKSNGTWSAPVEQDQTDLVSFDDAGDNALVPTEEAMIYSQVSSTGFVTIAPFVSDKYFKASIFSSMISPDGLWVAASTGIVKTSPSDDMFQDLTVGSVSSSGISSSVVANVQSQRLYSAYMPRFIPATASILFLGQRTGETQRLMQSSIVIGPTHVAARVAGSATVGKTLTATATSSAIPAPTLTYQWYRCSNRTSTKLGIKCSAISKATKRSYKLTRVDRAKFIYVKVTARNSAGSAFNASLTTAKVK